MFSRLLLSASSVLLVASTAVSAGRIVQDPEMCAFSDPFDSQEIGLALTETEMFAIEFYCEMSEPLNLNWDRERIETRVGYCSEPGILTPQVWSFVFSPYEDGKITVWWQGQDEPTQFISCD